MTLNKRLYWIGGLAVVLVLAVAAVTYATGISASGSDTCNADEAPAGGPIAPEDVCVGAGQLDDGKHLLPQAAITVDDAINAAMSAADGDLGEIDLEHYQGKLVFNVDVGDQDVKVDAGTGEVLGSGKD